MPCMLTLPPAFEHASMQGISPLGGRGSAAFVGSSTSSTNSTISILIGIDLKIRGCRESRDAGCQPLRQPVRQAAMGFTLSSSASNVLSTALTVHLALARRPGSNPGPSQPINMTQIGSVSNSKWPDKRPTRDSADHENRRRVGHGHCELENV